MGATHQFKLTDIGEGIAEVQIVEWFVKVGDTVEEMDILCSVESDKASVELTSPHTGKITKIYHGVDETVKVGSLLVDFEVGNDSSAPAPTASAPALEVPTPQPPVPTEANHEIKQFKLSDIGEGIAEVQITEWFVKEGDHVLELSTLCSVESDKASVEVTSPFDGIVSKIYWEVDDTVKVGEVLLDFRIEREPAPESASEAVLEEPATAPAIVDPMPQATSEPGQPGERIKAPRVLATPKVRGMARKLGIDLNSVKGSGNEGRVLPEDLEEAIKPKPEPKHVASDKPTAKPAPPEAIDVDEVVQITDQLGKGMVKSMTQALSQPVMGLGEELDITELVAMQKRLKSVSKDVYGVRVSLTTFFIKALSMALTAHPKLNSKFNDSEPPSYTVHGKHNICVAIETPHGLVNPNIKDVGNLSVLEIQRKLVQLAKAANERKLTFEDNIGGTITISNIGMIGVKDPIPILYGGQALIIGIGRLMVLPRYNDEMELVPRQIVNIRIVADHRHLDGATVAHFSNTFRRLVEDPLEWSLSLR